MATDKIALFVLSFLFLLNSPSIIFSHSSDEHNYSHHTRFSTILIFFILLAFSLIGCDKFSLPECEPIIGEYGLTFDCELNRSSDCQLVSKDYGPAGTVDINVEVIATGLEIPWGIAWLPDGDMLVTERTGALLRIKTNGTVMTVSDVSIPFSGEGGLLGIAVHPQFTNNRWFYLYYTTTSLAGINVSQVERWILSEDGLSATADKVIIANIPALLFHNGGRIRFGPDGYLYVGTGDAGNPLLAQDVYSLSGKILRVTDDGQVPNGNPFPESLTWIYGVRNTQGFDWLSNGRFVMTDHGPSELPQEGGRKGRDEINIASSGDNLGWPLVYGCESLPGPVSPLMSWVDPLPPGGTAVYTGSEIPEWKDDVFIGVLGFDDSIPHLHRIQLSGNEVKISETYLRGQGFGRLRDVIMGPDGGLYVTTSECDGRGACGDGDKILRIGRR